MSITVKTGTLEEFFARGKALAEAADEGRLIPKGLTITFTHIEDFLRVMSAQRLAVYRAVRRRPGTIKEIAADVHRHHDVVGKDIRLLAEVGMVNIRKVKNPKHGLMNFVEPVTDAKIKLEAVI